MAHNSYTRLGGVWAAGSVVLAAEAADLDAKTFAAINGDAGGAWAPAAPIEIAGAGLEIHGAPFKLYDGAAALALWFDEATPRFEFYKQARFNSASLNLSGTSQLVVGGAGGIINAGSLDQTGDATFAGDVQLGDAVGDTLDVRATSTFAEAVAMAKTLEVTGELTALHDVTLGLSALDSLTVAAAANFNAAAAFAGAVSISDPVTLSGDGTIRYRVTAGADADTTYGVDSYDEVRIAWASLSAPRIYTISNTGGAAGARFRLSTFDAGNDVTVKRGDGSTIGQLKVAAGFYRFMDLIWIAGQWEVGAYHYA